jgi:hypothetical protein
MIRPVVPDAEEIVWHAKRRDPVEGNDEEKKRFLQNLLQTVKILPAINKEENRAHCTELSDRPLNLFSQSQP